MTAICQALHRLIPFVRAKQAYTQLYLMMGASFGLLYESSLTIGRKEARSREWLLLLPYSNPWDNIYSSQRLLVHSLSLSLNQHNSRYHTKQYIRFYLFKILLYPSGHSFLTLQSLHLSVPFPVEDEYRFGILQLTIFPILQGAAKWLFYRCTRCFKYFIVQRF